MPAANRSIIRRSKPSSSRQGEQSGWFSNVWGKNIPKQLVCLVSFCASFWEPSHASGKSSSIFFLSNAAPAEPAAWWINGPCKTFCGLWISAVAKVIVVFCRKLISSPCASYITPWPEPSWLAWTLMTDASALARRFASSARPGSSSSLASQQAPGTKMLEWFHPIAIDITALGHCWNHLRPLQAPHWHDVSPQISKQHPPARVSLRVKLVLSNNRIRLTSPLRPSIASDKYCAHCLEACKCKTAYRC